MQSYHLNANTHISKVEGNIHQIVIKYVHGDSSYAGWSVHNFELRYEDSEMSDTVDHVVPVGRNLIYVNDHLMYVTQSVRPYYYLEVNTLIKVDTPTVIRIQCKDDQTTDFVATFINVTKMANIFSLVSFNQSNIPDFNVYENGDLFFSIHPEEVQGNALTYFVNFDAFAEPYTQTKIYDTTRIHIGWRVEKCKTDFVDIHFTGNMAIAVDHSYTLCAFKCHLSLIHI